MRVITGKAGRIQLKTIKGMHTRPTTDRIKETLFNILNPNLEDVNFLDLFAGSGGIGIEALSRGARYAWFIDDYKEAVACIKTNLQKTGLGSQASVLQEDVFQALIKLDYAKIHMDIVFLDPPYNQHLEKDVLIFLSKSNLISTESLIIVETSLDTSLEYCDEFGFRIVREKIYKTNKHCFIRKKELVQC